VDLNTKNQLYMNNKAFVIFSFVLVVVNSLKAQENSSHNATNGERRIEMWEEPRHQLVFSKDQLKVMEVRVPPGDTSQFHSHQYATIYIVINDALMSGQTFGKPWKSSRSERRAKYSLSDRSEAYFGKQVYHRVCNPDTTTMHLIAILNTKPPSDEVFEEDKGVNNSWFRETRVQLAANESSSLLHFPYQTVIVQCTRGESAVLQEGVTHSVKTEEGAFSWHDQNVEFSLVNKSANPQEFVVIEVK
jgi:hypothetical protein